MDTLLPMTPGNLTLAAGLELGIITNVIRWFTPKTASHTYIISNNFRLSMRLEARNERIYR